MSDTTKAPQYVRTLAAVIKERRANGYTSAAVAVVTSTGCEVGIADAELRGYSRTGYEFDTMDQARVAADSANALAGIGELDVMAIRICSMFRPGEYDEVRASL